MPFIGNANSPAALPILPEPYPGLWLKLGDVDVSEGADYLRDLEAALQAIDGDLAVVAADDAAWRISGSLTGTQNIFESARLSDLAVTAIPPGAGGILLLHETGFDEAGLVVETEGALDAIEAILGWRPVSYAYPQHRHTRGLMTRLSDLGLLGARDGDPYGTGQGEPTQGFLLGYHTTDEWRKTWGNFLPFELTTHGEFIEATLQARTSAADMEDLIFDTVAHGVISSTVCYGYSSLAALWKAKRTCVNCYVHGATGDPTDLDTTRLGWLLDALIADGDFWITDFQSAMRRLRAAHKPTVADPLIWDLHPDKDPGPANPYEGKKVGFVFSTDDGNERNVDYDAIFAAKGNRKWTAFIVPDWIDDANRLTTAELVALHEGGRCEIGCHSTTHGGAGGVLTNEACKITSAATTGRAITVSDLGGGDKRIRVSEQTIGSPLVLPETFRYLDGNLELSNGVPVPTWTDEVAAADYVAQTVNPTYLASWKNGLGAVNFDAATGEYYLGGFEDWHDNTEGMIILFVGEWHSSGWRPIITKYNSTLGSRFWRLWGCKYSMVCEDKNTDGPTTGDFQASWPSSTPAIVALYWEPGVAHKIYVNGALIQTATGAINDFDADSGSNQAIAIGTGRAGASGYFDGRMGSIVCVKKASSDYLSKLNKWASARWDIALP